MSNREKWKWVYRVVRSVLFSAVAFVAFLFVALYVMLSIPSVQRRLCDVGREELSGLIGSEVTVGEVSVSPFNEILLGKVVIFQPDGNKIAEIKRIGAGISLWNLIVNRRIVITYAEIYGMDADIYQNHRDAPLNIQFLIDAFKPKDKNKPPSKFNLEIRNIVLRKCAVKFDKKWIKRSEKELFDINHLSVSDLSADVAMPCVSDTLVDIDLRRLAFNLYPEIEVNKVCAYISLRKGDVSVRNLEIATPYSQIEIGDIDLPLASAGGFKKMIESTSFDLKIRSDRFVPSDFRGFVPALSEFGYPFALQIDVCGNSDGIDIRRLGIYTKSEGISFVAENVGLKLADNKPDNVFAEMIELRSTAEFNAMLASRLSALSHSGFISSNVQNLIKSAGNVSVFLSGNAALRDFSGELNASVSSSYGEIDLNGIISNEGMSRRLLLDVVSDNFDLGSVLASDKVGTMTLALNADAILSKKLFEADLKAMTAKNLNNLITYVDADLSIDEAVINSYPLKDFNLSVAKRGESSDVNIECSDPNLDINLAGNLVDKGKESVCSFSGDLRNISPFVFGIQVGSGDMKLSADLDAAISGNSVDNISGYAIIGNLELEDIVAGKNISLDRIELISDLEESGQRRYQLLSDWAAGEITGKFFPGRIVRQIQSILACAYPDLIKSPTPSAQNALDSDDYMTCEFTVYPDKEWPDIFNIPIRPLYDVTIKGLFDNSRDLVSVSVDAPYLQQGHDKLIRNTRLSASISDEKGNVNFYTAYPAKKGIIDLQGALNTLPGNLAFDLDFNPGSNGAFYGRISIDADLKNVLNAEGRSISARILPGEFYLNGSRWNIGEADIEYADGRISVRGLSIGSGDQYLTIAGTASAAIEDEMLVTLNNIDLNYIFDTLNINYVTFGGVATGEAIGQALLSKNPVAFTRGLKVKNLSYNGGVLGDGDMTGSWETSSKRVGIGASISEGGRHCADVNGGIWIGRDSLAFDIGADKVRIGFLQPFMSAFASKVEGRASGDALLYGTFKDVNMKGRLFADTISMKVDYTNVTYCGSDSVIIDPGHIRIPSFTLRDVYGHTARLTGDLRHNYFHDPEFEFRIDNARSILLYDTNSGLNPIWYGRIFGSGFGKIIGEPGRVAIVADMSTQHNSTFTFVLDEKKEAAEYKFLTFTDKTKTQREVSFKDADVPDRIEEAFRKKVEEQEGAPSVFEMDIRAALTPQAQLTLVMDPKSDDKIIARGSGPMNITYDSKSDEMKMLGKYTIEEGVYNFSFQDIILKDFIIKQGSNISFNGSPYSANLDIRAAYRVNTNLTDLDKSFATDRDLNRTNVPVDAMLLVRGAMEHPDISFDIELPTLNDEVEQKVRSIISSEDMMNRQMIYLLALNRFYTPEYMGGNSTGAEWTSVASTTLSSQISNILDQLTDKVSVAPSLRSDKGDFSDVEVDLALSSRLFNNRLLVNGNFGYRDRSTSNTTFVGDFDVEYLINRSGNFRLKAYNHFNDQNYYLKSALTTQGVGVIWRKDFDHFIFRPRKKRQTVKDSVQ